MRILAISDLYPPVARGGAEVMTAEAVDGLRDRGHDVVVATGAQGATTSHVRPCLEYRPSPRWEGGRSWLVPWRAAASYRRAFRNRRNEAAIRSLLAEFRPDVVYLGGISGVGPASVLRTLGAHSVPVVAHLHDYWLLTLLRGGGQFSALRLPRLKRIIVGLDRRRDLQLTSMIAISRTLRDEYVEAGFTPQAIEIIPYGQRLPHVRRPQGPAGDGQLRLLFVGRLVPEKGVHLLLERLAVLAAEAQGRRIRCDLVGPSGPEWYMRCVHELVGRLGGSVRILGPVQREDMLQLYAQYDAVVVPSLWREPFGLVVPEALAAGAAVVASRSVGAAECFEDGLDVVLFWPQRVWELDESLRRLRDEPGLAARLAEAGSRKAVRLFDRETFRDRVEEHLEMARGRPKLSPLLSETRRPGQSLSPAAAGERRVA